jgi:hypothetical protein
LIASEAGDPNIRLPVRAHRPGSIRVAARAAAAHASPSVRCFEHERCRIVEAAQQRVCRRQTRE